MQGVAVEPGSAEERLYARVFQELRPRTKLSGVVVRYRRLANASSSIQWKEGWLEAHLSDVFVGATVAAALTAWIDKHEHFVVQRATLGRVTYEPLDSFAGAMRKVKRVFEGASAKPYQSNTELLTAVITPLEDGFCHVAVMATLRRSRRNYLAGAATLAGTGVALTAGVMALVQYPAAELLAMIPAVAGLGTGALTARSYRPIAERAQLGLERMLDDLERRPALGPGTPPPPRSQQIGREVGQVVKDITREVRKALEEK